MNIAKMPNDSDIKQSLDSVRSKIAIAKRNRPDDLQDVEPRLVAVSKTKPLEMILEAYEEGQWHFGENYPQELIAKATDKQILEKCKNIKWHFIGHLQSNKASRVVSLPNLFIIETIDSQKLASLVNSAAMKNNIPQLNVFVQVNTSLEDEKNGVRPDDVVPLCKFVINECPNLKFCGLMTIGKYGYDTSLGPNPDFLTLTKCKEDVCRELNLSPNHIELSMGMSDDFEQAIELGSSNVRVGSLIFGFRGKKIKPSITEI